MYIINHHVDEDNGSSAYSDRPLKPDRDPSRALLGQESFPLLHSTHTCKDASLGLSHLFPSRSCRGPKQIEGSIIGLIAIADYT